MYIGLKKIFMGGALSLMIGSPLIANANNEISLSSFLDKHYFSKNCLVNSLYSIRFHDLELMGLEENSLVSYFDHYSSAECKKAKIHNSLERYSDFLQLTGELKTRINGSDVPTGIRYEINLGEIPLINIFPDAGNISLFYPDGRKVKYWLPVRFGAIDSGLDHERWGMIYGDFNSNKSFMRLKIYHLTISG